MSPMYIAKQNARIIIQDTTAYPFRLPESTMVCVFCCENYPEPNLFRKHMEDSHKDFKVMLAFAHIQEGYLKVDCTDLRCRICNEQFERIQEAAVHLKTAHNRNLDLDYDCGLQPFKIKTDLLSCGVCDHRAFNLCTLSKHIHKHFLQYTCEACGKSYSTATSFVCHIKYGCPMTTKQRFCRKCKQKFDTVEEMKLHLEMSKKCCLYVCNVCGDRFGNFNMKLDHMKEVHGIKKKYPCPECTTVFTNRSSLKRHFKIVHSTDSICCSECGRIFDCESALTKHITVHTGEKSFTCSVCLKSFSRKSTLTQHMWIHSDVKRHECKLCDKKFNQRVSWKTHMKLRHPELCDF